MLFLPAASNTRRGNYVGGRINAYQDISILISGYKFTMTLDKAAFKFLIHSSKLTNTKKITKHIYKISILCPAVQAMEYLSKVIRSVLSLQSAFDFSSGLVCLFRVKRLHNSVWGFLQ